MRLRRAVRAEVRGVHRLHAVLLALGGAAAHGRADGAASVAWRSQRIETILAAEIKLEVERKAVRPLQRAAVRCVRGPERATGVRQGTVHRFFIDVWLAS